MGYKFLALLLLQIAAQCFADKSERPSTPAKADLTRTYWTPGRIASAKPYPLPRSHTKEEPLRNVKNSRPRPLTIVQQVQNVTRFPYSTMGKLLFTDFHGSDYWCSAQYVGNLRVILTAAHCVYTVGDGACAQWNKNFQFQQQKNGAYFTTRAVKTPWVKNSFCKNVTYNYAQDYAFCSMYDSSISDDYLGLGYPDAWTFFTSYGYPGNFGNQNYLESYAGYKTTVTGGQVLMPYNPMDGGCAGGAWLASDQTATGVNSHADSSTTGVWSPQFNTDTVNLWQSAYNDVNQ